MGRIGKGHRLAPGIHRYTMWIRARVKVRDQTRERHYPLGTELDEIRKWQLRTRASLLEGLPRRADRGTLEHDIPRYLAILSGKRFKDERSLLQHWVLTPLRSIPRVQITRPLIKAQLARWEEAGVCAATLNHRLRVLRNVYRELDGEDEPNPTDKIKKRPTPPAQARGQPLDLIGAIIACLPDRGQPRRHQVRPEVSLTKARARVMAWTGLPPAQVMQILPVHFHREAATLVVQPRRKGKGVPGQTLPLLPQAVNALVEFFEAGAQGRFSTSSFRMSWIRAQASLVETLRRKAIDEGGDPSAVQLPHIRPYDIRHSFGTEAYRRSKDLLGVRQLMLHAKTTTTERYIEGAAAPAAENVLAAWQRGTEDATRRQRRT